MDKKKSKGSVWALIIFVAVFLISLGVLLYNLVYLPKQNSALVEDLKENFIQTSSIQNVEVVDLGEIREKYPDIKAWITIPDTTIDYPVLQTGEDDPEHYLRQNYRDEYDYSGSIFLQYDCNFDKSDNLTVYGHNMKNGTMFAPLINYASKEYYDSHNKIYLQKENELREYTILSVMKNDLEGFPFQTTDFTDSFTKEDYVNMAKELSIYDTEVSLTNNDAQLTTLVTCSYENDDTRNIIVAVNTDSISF